MRRVGLVLADDVEGLLSPVVANDRDCKTKAHLRAVFGLRHHVRRSAARAPIPKVTRSAGHFRTISGGLRCSIDFLRSGNFGPDLH